MLVKQILTSKHDDQVATVPPGTTMAQVVGLLADKRIGALVVSSDGVAVAGIVSERDVVRELARRGPGVLRMPVESLMTTRVVGCGLQDRANDVLEQMTRGRFRHMPVLEGGRMVGLISIGDLVKARLAELSMEVDALEGMIKGF
ncbi:CBS domain-containing protein [Rhodobacter ferrooxidans]|uniref:Putative signal transduction protein with CBS domains n=1 Tax=Rhodobacter ferrooxidans TaxID=371731 RepID=C8RZJ3_9RHOB|nr:CBS domain-containing protein [Rhodobacter sp. SW2]EEW25790.1 putative signal transduction protein with CBS domains [Rhodobacter sp. SW2]